MGWLSKIILNGTEMLIKDATARSGISELVQNIQYLQQSINYIWNGIPPTHEVRYYVSPNGSDNNDGLTEETAFASITKAYSKVNDYIACHRNCIFIRIMPGSYTENVVVGASNNNIQINLELMGSVNIYGSFSVANSKVWMFDTSPNYDSTLTIWTTRDTENVRGENTPLCITESGEFYYNHKIVIMCTSDQTWPEAVDIFFASKIYNSNFTNDGALTIGSGEFTDGVIKVVDSEFRSALSVPSASVDAPYTFIASYSTIFDGNIDQTPHTIDDDTINSIVGNVLMPT